MKKNQTASCSFFCTSDKLVHRRDDASVEQIDDPVGETGIVLGVSHHDDRGPFPVQFGEQLHHFGSVLRVQVTGRLIGEDDLRIRNDSTCDGHTLLLSSGKLLREMARAVADVHPFQDIVHHLLTLAGFYFQVGKREFHVFEHVQFVNQVEALEHETDVAFADLRTLLLLEMPDFPGIKNYKDTPHSGWGTPR